MVSTVTISQPYCTYILRYTFNDIQSNENMLCQNYCQCVAVTGHGCPVVPPLLTHTASVPYPKVSLLSSPHTGLCRRCGLAKSQTNVTPSRVAKKSQTRKNGFSALWGFSYAHSLGSVPSPLLGYTGVFSAPV